jgi:hypothetical protein
MWCLRPRPQIRFLWKSGEAKRKAEEHKGNEKGIDYSRIKYRHTTLHLSETTISEEELAYLREMKRRIEHQAGKIEKRTNNILVIN